MSTADDKHNLWAIRDGFIDCLPFPIEVVAQNASSSLPVAEEERLLVQRAVPIRQADFIGGRWCAHQALGRMGVVVSALLVGPRGEPIWPPEIAGSITHESGLCVAAVAQKTIIHSIGIDLLNSKRPTLFESLSSLVTTSADTIQEATPIVGSERVMLLFTIKEAVVKAVSATIGRYIEMTEIEVTSYDRSFHASIRATALTVEGRWRRVGAFVLAAAFVLKRSKSEKPPELMLQSGSKSPFQISRSCSKKNRDEPQ